MNTTIRDKHGNFPIHRAVTNQTMELVHHLLTEGANPSVKNRGGMTPLHLAAIMNNSSIWSCLLDFGANPFIRNDNNQLPSDLQQSVGLRERLYTKFSYTACNDLVKHLQLSKSQRVTLYPAIQAILQQLDQERHLRPDEELTSHHQRQCLINAMVNQFRPYVKKDWRGRYSIPNKVLKRITENSSLISHLIYDTFMSFLRNPSHGQYTEMLRTLQDYSHSFKNGKSRSKTTHEHSREQLFEPVFLGQNPAYHVQSAPDLPHPSFLRLGRHSLDNV